MARRFRTCVKWKYGPKRTTRRRGKKHCRFGVVKKGRRKGQCLKAKRARKRRKINTAKRGRYIFHGR